MAVNVSGLQYPFDPTGAMLANLVEGEQQILTPPNFRDYYFIVPKVAPFFADSMRITFKGLDNSQRLLIEGVDYYLTHWFLSASRACAKSIYGSVTFLDKTMAGVVTMRYQTIGGIWVLNDSQIAEILANQVLNPRITTWESIVDLPATFPVIDHEWDLVDMVGASEVVNAIDRITAALNSSGGNAITEHIANLSNPHQTTAAQVGLGNVPNYLMASQAQAQAGLIDTAFMSPLRVKNAIDVFAAALVNAHANNQANPHNTTAAQIGLGNVQNYSMASNAEAIAGTLTSRYVSPANLKAVVDNFTNTTFAKHVNNLLNPHQVDKVQVGLGNVDNFATASSDEARLGNANDVFMTPLRTKQAIQALAGGDISAHLTDYSNPHLVTAAQVGLGNVQNYGVASDTQTIAGTAANLYTTPKSVVAAIKALVADDFYEHLIDTNNPHGVTAGQVGAYTIAQTNTLVNGKLDVGGTAANSSMFGTMTVDQYKDYVLNGKSADTFAVDGRNSDALKAWILTGKAASAGNSDTLEGKTVNQIVALAVGQVTDDNNSAEQIRYPFSTVATGAGNWSMIASVDMPVEGAPTPDGQMLVTGGDTTSDKISGTWLVRVSTRGIAPNQVSMQVVNLTGQSIAGAQFGWVLDGTANTVRVYLKTNLKRSEIACTKLSGPLGLSAPDQAVLTAAPAGITMVTESGIATAQQLTTLSQTVTTQGQDLATLTQTVTTMGTDIETALNDLATAFNNLAAAQA